MTSTLEREMVLLTADLLDAIRKWRVAKGTFAAVTESYLNGRRDAVTAEIRASSDQRRIRAIADASWYQQEIQTAALAILALREGVGR